MVRLTKLALVLALVSALHHQPALAEADAEATTSQPQSQLKLYAFFASWCVPCRVELPALQELADRYRDTGLDVVLVSQDAPSTAANVPAFLASHRITLPWVLDSESQLVARYNQTATLPFTALVRGDGSVAYSHAGYEPGDEEQLEAQIKANLGAKETEARGGLDVQLSSQTLGVNRRSRFDPIPENDGLLRAAAERFEVSAYTNGFGAALRIDGAVINDDARGDANDITLERARVTDTFGPLTLTLGDDYVSVGNGMSLSLRKVDQLGVDTALRGGNARLATAAGTLTVIAGVTNPQNLDPLDLRVLSPSSDLIVATEIETDLGRVTLTPYGMIAYADEAGPGGEQARWLIGGSAGEIDLAPFQASFEVAGGQRKGLAFTSETPLAGHVAMRLQKGDLAGLIELKAYRDWAFGRSQDGLLYHEPPTLEEPNQEVPGNENSIGGRSRFDYAPSETLSMFANLLHYRYTDDGTTATDGSDASHLYGGVSGRTVGADWSLISGYRHERNSDGDFKLNLWHVDADLSRPLEYLWGSTLSATFKWNHREEEKQLFSRFAFRRGLAVVGVSLAGRLAVSALYGYSTERRDESAPTHYPGGELSVVLPRGGSLRMFLGRLTGGRVCVSGSCRDVQPFEGGRIDLIFRY